MDKTKYYLVNVITLYRLLVAPVLLYLVYTKDLNAFKYLLPVSFFTDLADGFLARKLRVTSVLGAKLDSIADDVTILVAMFGLFIFKPWFILSNWMYFVSLLILFIIQVSYALIKYKKITSFHTYLAKFAALLQGLFLIVIFLLDEPVYPLFYVAIIITALDLIEEIILVYILPSWIINVRGIYWVLKKRNHNTGS